MKEGLITSIHARLLNVAKKRGEDFNLTLTRYAAERFLYRLSVSRFRNDFCLKGALLFDLWFHLPHRPTRDADFLGLGAADAKILKKTVQEICGILANDGMRFDSKTVTVKEIRENARYDGLRVKLLAYLGKARITVQLDVGYGDAVTPNPKEAKYPTLLDDLPNPIIQVYPKETVVSEKLEAITSLGMANSRMKDYFDLLILAGDRSIKSPHLADAIHATFKRRGTPIPDDLPLGLSDEFSMDRTKQTQWNAFLSKNGLEAPSLGDTLKKIRTFVLKPLKKRKK